MSRILAALFALVLAVALVGCTSEAEADHTAFDDAVHSIERSIARFYSLGSGASAEKVRSEVERLDAQWQDAAAKGASIEGIDLAPVNASMEELVSATSALPDDAPEGEPMKVAVPLLETFAEELEVVHEAGDFH